MNQDWRAWAASLFVMAAIAAFVYAAVGSVRDWLRPRLERPEREEKEIHPDFYVYHPKSYVDSLESARKLVGKPLWVKEGYRWTCEPGERMLKPLEKVVPTEVRRRGNEVLLEFTKRGGQCELVIGAGGKFYVDEIFLLKDPRELYDHWSEDMWQKVEAGQVEPGMTEFQVAFSLGAGSLSRYSPGGSVRVLEYTLRTKAGLPAVRVTFEDGIATKVEEIAEGPEV